MTEPPPPPPPRPQLLPTTPPPAANPQPTSDNFKHLFATFANKRPKFLGLWFEGKEVDLDGITYENCRFDNCRLSIATGDIDLIACVIDEDSNLVIGGYAARVAKIINRTQSIDSLSKFKPTIVGNRITISSTKATP